MGTVSPVESELTFLTFSVVPLSTLLYPPFFLSLEVTPFLPEAVTLLTVPLGPCSFTASARSEKK